MNRRFSALLVFFMATKIGHSPCSAIRFHSSLGYLTAKGRMGNHLCCLSLVLSMVLGQRTNAVTYLCSCPSSKSCLGIGCRPFNRRTSIVEYWLVLRVLPRRFPLSLAVFASRDIGSICSVVLAWAICLRADHLLLFRPLPYEDDM